MVDDRGMNDAGDRPRRARWFVEGLSKVSPLDQVREPLQELADVNCRAVQIKEPLCEDGDGNDAAGQNRPHEQAALLDVIDHLELSLPAFGAPGKRGRWGGQRKARKKVRKKEFIFY
jgi:hypothetical protein